MYLNRHKRVNTILTFSRLRARRGSGHAQWCEVDQDRSHHPVVDRDNVCFSEDCYGLGGAVGRGLGVAANLGVGVGLGVGVAVAVPVAVAVGVAVGVAVAVAVGVGLGETVGVGVGVPCGTELTAAKASTRPYPNELFGIVVLGIPPQV